MGGILLIFGFAVYISVIVTVTNQLDSLLARTAEDIIRNTRVNPVGQLNLITIPALDLPNDIYVQVWGRDGQIRSVSPNLDQVYQPLDPVAIQSTLPVYRDVTLVNARLRVLTVPLKASDRLIGTLQVATRLDTVLALQQTLRTVLYFGTAISIIITGIAVWVSTLQALKPLDSVRQVALQITRADDLSRRIPYRGPQSDEVGQLITAFNQTLARLENLFNTQRRFLADVGHELRTPLTVIKGNVGLMQRIGEVDEESLATISNEVDRLTRLVGDLLLLAQAESGKLPLALRIVSMDTLVLGIMSEMRVLARDRVQLQLGELDQVLVCGDEDRLKQVIVNLIGNAINYTPVGGQIIVSIGKVGSQAQLTIRDTGPGIPAQDLPHIFERFYRGEKSRTRQRDGKGFGLGLSIAYWIVRNHGGRIEVDSTVGKGTTFCVWLPLAEENCSTEREVIAG
jgi:signal transduction histidine kinase